MGLLDGVDAKIHRARTHLEELKRALETVLDPGLYRFTSEDDGEPSKQVIGSAPTSVDSFG